MPSWKWQWKHNRGKMLKASRRCLSKAHRSSRFIPSVLRNLKKAQKAAWVSPNRKSKKQQLASRRNAILARENLRKTSKPQIALFRRLCRAGVSGIKLEHRILIYKVDIAHLPTKTAVECDGKYFHASRKSEDKKRDRRLKSLGWKTIRIALSGRKQARDYDISHLVRLLRRR